MALPIISKAWKRRNKTARHHQTAIAGSRFRVFVDLFSILAFFLLVEVILVNSWILGSGMHIADIRLSTQDYFISDSGALQQGPYLNTKLGGVSRGVSDGNNQFTQNPLESDYGNTAVVLGKETCVTYRSGLKDGRLPSIVIVGLFQRHSSLISHLMRKNCLISESETDFVRSLGWEKHFPSRNIPSTILPVIVVQDPFPWAKDICTDRPEELVFVGDKVHREECPKLVDDAGMNEKLTLTYRHFQNSTVHSSLVALWNDWYNPWFHTDVAHIIIRDEDILTNTENVVTAVCTCIGGTIHDPFRNKDPPHVDRSPKRFEGWNEESIKHATSTLDRNLLHKLGYGILDGAKL